MNKPRTIKSKYIPEVGRAYGHLTVMDETVEMRSGAGLMFHVQCKCGTVKYVSARKLEAGETKSCGCARVVDLTGVKSGFLTYVEDAGMASNRDRLIKAQCACGNQIIVRVSRFIQGNVKSCGCYRQQIHKSGIHRRDITGLRSGRLVAVEYSHTKSCAYWKCRCDCGNEVFVQASAIITGRTKSCGCLGREIARNMLLSKKGIM